MSEYNSSYNYASDKSTYARQGAIITANFNASKTFYSCSFHFHSTDYLVNSVKGAATLAKAQMECKKKFTNPGDEQIYETFVGTGHALMASTLSLAMWTPLLLTLCLRNFTCS